MDNFAKWQACEAVFYGAHKMSRFIQNSFQMPNAVIDEYLCKLSGNAFKCYALIARQTTGWNKQSDRISISQFMDKCGIKDRKTAFSCLAELERVLLIKTYKSKGEITEFSLNFEFEDVDSEPVPKNGTSTSTKNWHTTKDTIKNNITNNTLTGINVRTKKSPAELLLEQFGITDRLAKDFITHRNACKAPITETALKGYQREAEKAGISIQQAVEIAIERGWRGFRADWDWRSGSQNLAKNPLNQTASKPSAHTGFTERNYGQTSTPDWAEEV